MLDYWFHEKVRASTAVAFGWAKGETKTGRLLLRGEANRSTWGVPKVLKRRENCAAGSSHPASRAVGLDRASAITFVIPAIWWALPEVASFSAFDRREETSAWICELREPLFFIVHTAQELSVAIWMDGGRGARAVEALEMALISRIFICFVWPKGKSRS